MTSRIAYIVRKRLFYRVTDTDYGWGDRGAPLLYGYPSA